MSSTLYSCQILMKFEFLDTFSKKDVQIPSLIKIRLVGAELIHAEGPTGKPTDLT